MLREELDALGIGRARVAFIPMLLPIYKVLPKMIETFEKKVKAVGPGSRAVGTLQRKTGSSPARRQGTVAPEVGATRASSSGLARNAMTWGTSR